MVRFEGILKKPGGRGRSMGAIAEEGRSQTQPRIASSIVTADDEPYEPEKRYDSLELFEEILTIIASGLMLSWGWGVASCLETLRPCDRRSAD
jgi:hypothetical protein